MEPDETEPSQCLGLGADAGTQSERTAHQGTPLPDGDRGTRQKAKEEETFLDKQTCIIFHFIWRALQVLRTDRQTEPKAATLIPLLFLPAHLCSSPYQRFKYLDSTRQWDRGADISSFPV